MEDISCIRKQQATPSTVQRVDPHLPHSRRKVFAQLQASGDVKEAFTNKPKPLADAVTAGRHCGRRPPAQTVFTTAFDFCGDRNSARAGSRKQLTPALPSSSFDEPTATANRRALGAGMRPRDGNVYARPQGIKKAASGGVEKKEHNPAVGLTPKNVVVSDSALDVGLRALAFTPTTRHGVPSPGPSDILMQRPASAQEQRATIAKAYTRCHEKARNAHTPLQNLPLQEHRRTRAVAGFSANGCVSTPPPPSREGMCIGVGGDTKLVANGRRQMSWKNHSSIELV
jgi:hypothetical protein